VHRSGIHRNIIDDGDDDRDDIDVVVPLLKRPTEAAFSSHNVNAPIGLMEVVDIAIKQKKEALMRLMNVAIF
jgi:hypothetical protein